MAIGDFLTSSEVAAMLGVNSSRVRQLYMQGRLKGKKVGSILLFEKDIAKAFAKQDRLPGRPKA